MYVSKISIVCHSAEVTQNVSATLLFKIIIDVAKSDFAFLAISALHWSKGKIGISCDKPMEKNPTSKDCQWNDGSIVSCLKMKGVAAGLGYDGKGPSAW